MPIKPPPGFLTRAEATKQFNRSQRALERDLDVALTIENADVLCHYKLVTKDGLVRDAEDVSIEQVKELMAGGMVPTWCTWVSTTTGSKTARCARAAVPISIVTWSAGAGSPR